LYKQRDKVMGDTDNHTIENAWTGVKGIYVDAVEKCLT
jgi:hypothetical protein